MILSLTQILKYYAKKKSCEGKKKKKKKKVDLKDLSQQRTPLRE